MKRKKNGLRNKSKKRLSKLKKVMKVMKFHTETGLYLSLNLIKLRRKDMLFASTG